MAAAARVIYHCRSEVRYSIDREVADDDGAFLLCLVLVLFLVLFVTAVASGVVGLRFPCSTAVLALFDRTSLGIYVMQLPIYKNTKFSS